MNFNQNAMKRGINSAVGCFSNKAKMKMIQAVVNGISPGMPSDAQVVVEFTQMMQKQGFGISEVYVCDASDGLLRQRGEVTALPGQFVDDLMHLATWAKGRVARCQEYVMGQEVPQQWITRRGKYYVKNAVLCMKPLRMRGRMFGGAA